MNVISRRSFNKVMVVIPLASWVGRLGAADLLVRPDVYSPEGQAMLKTYAEAVDKMMKMGEGEPIGWLFQWYMHFVKGSTTKAAEITRVYGATSSANKDLAQATWDTCQAHSPGEVENMFLPWHRMFVYYFEQIVRETVKPKPFVLPYWNYSASASSIHGILPPDFRLPNATSNSLFRTSRNTIANAGQPIDQNDPGALNLDVLTETSYAPNGAKQGFCMGLDFNLHGNVHVLVGNNVGMGQVPWAAYDPIFWMHHCNIDRLWASWNRFGGKNPSDASFLGTEFLFADKTGKKVTATVKDFLDIEALGYTYQQFEPKPPGFVPAQHIQPFEFMIERTGKAAPFAKNVALSPALLRIPLQSPPPPSKGPLLAFEAQVKALTPRNGLYVVLSGFHAETPPEVLYHVYLNLPEGVTADKGGEYYVGTINFFDAVAHDNVSVPGTAAGPTKFQSLNATQVAKRMQGRGTLTPQPSISIIPSAMPALGSNPMIGGISLVTQ